MNKDIMKQYALPMIVIGTILIIAGGYHAFNPVLAVSAHDDRADVQRMLATTTFTVGTSYTSCSELDMALLQSHDNNPQNGKIDAVELLVAINNANAGVLQWDEYYQIEYAWRTWCPIDLPVVPAQIDDSTDTLTLTASSYNPGDTVEMLAWGENIGGEEWHGAVTFTVTQPDGSVYVIKESDGINVGAGSSTEAGESFTLPSDAASGAWTIQSKWIDDGGNIHAMSTIDLGTETIWGYDISMIGVLIALIGLLIVGYGLAKRKS